MTEESTFLYLEMFGITEIKQFMFGKGDTFVKKSIFMVTFDTYLSTKIGYELVPVSPYIPNSSLLY